MSRYRWHAVPDFVAIALLTGLLLVSGLAPATAAEPEQQTSQDGTVVVPWKAGYARYQTLKVQLANGDVFSQYPVVAEQDWVITGLPDGQYRFSLSGPDAQTPILSLDVRHYSLASAFGLFSLGLIMFIYLLIALFKGSRDD